MPREPSRARRASAIVNWHISGRPGPGPRSTDVGPMLPSASSSEGLPAPRPLTTTTSAPRLAKVFAMLRLKESRLSTKSIRVCDRPPLSPSIAATGNNGASPMVQERQPPPLNPPLQADWERAAKSPSTRTFTGSMGCCSSPSQPLAAPLAMHSASARDTRAWLSQMSPPKAVCKSRAAFILASSTSASGSDSIVNPPPALTCPVHISLHRVASRVRMSMFHWPSPLCKSTYPMLPVQLHLLLCSISSMAAIVAVFGQPVIEPPGNTAARASQASVPERRRPSTLLTICCTLGKDSTRQLAQCTEPASQVRARS
mmetsp:Transcript_110301/g.246107  ORF Transcript_110301/g.246107 Transcript_110301/m.246107 type:complete len:314 (+) Transcript_110301:78-1019(+)